MDHLIFDDFVPDYIIYISPTFVQNTILDYVNIVFELFDIRPMCVLGHIKIN